MKRIIIPEENQKYLEEIPAFIRKDLKFVPVKHIEEVLKVALHPDGKAPRPASARPRAAKKPAKKPAAKKASKPAVKKSAKAAVSKAAKKASRPAAKKGSKPASKARKASGKATGEA